MSGGPRDPLAVIAEALAAHPAAEAKAEARAARSRQPAAEPARCFVALGDSFTAGSGCPPEQRWADRLATSLRRRSPDLVYRNLARHGATSAEVLEQAGLALQLEPDLVTVVCGANDVLETVRPDVDAAADRIAAIFDRLREPLPQLAMVTATAPECWRFLELGERTRRRVVSSIRALNAATRELAAQRSIPVVDVAGHPGLADPANFAADGLHPSALGHARAARAFERLMLAELRRVNLKREEGRR